MAGLDQTQSEVLKALADEVRLRLLRLLSRETLNVQELCQVLDSSQSRVSRHLGVLRRAGLVQDRREGNRIYYHRASLSGDLEMVAGYVDALAQQEHPDIERLAVILRRRRQESREFASGRAHEWDELGEQLHSAPALLLALAGLVEPTAVVADLGTGTGMLLPTLAMVARRVIAVDHAQEMVAAARERCRRLDLENVQVVQCALEDLPEQAPEPCDAMLLHFVAHQLAQPQGVIAALTACLKPGGRVVIVDRTRHEDTESQRRFGSRWLGFSREDVARWFTTAGLDLGLYRELPPHQEQAAPGMFVAVGRAGGAAGDSAQAGPCDAR